MDYFTLFDSISSASPFSIGSQIIVNLFFRLGVSEKHFSWEVSTTVSQKLEENFTNIICVIKHTVCYIPHYGVGNFDINIGVHFS